MTYIAIQSLSFLLLLLLQYPIIKIQAYQHGRYQCNKTVKLYKNNQKINYFQSQHLQTQTNQIMANPTNIEIAMEKEKEDNEYLNYKVEVYSTLGCKYCRIAKAKLDSVGVPYLNIGWWLC